jgi:hypothetical protein
MLLKHKNKHVSKILQFSLRLRIGKYLFTPENVKFEQYGPSTTLCN